MTTTLDLVANPLAAVRSPFVVPAGYSSHMHFADKVRAAVETAQTYAARRTEHHTVLAASVVGSFLRGSDTVDSDVDVLVVTAGKAKPKDFSTEFTDSYGKIWPVDATVVGLDFFLERVSSSVPYVEFLLSPFRVTVPAYAPFLNSYARHGWKTTEFVFHTQRFAEHVTSRGEKKVDAADNPEQEQRTQRKVHNTLASLDFLLATSTVAAPSTTFLNVS